MSQSDHWSFGYEFSKNISKIQQTRPKQFVKVCLYSSHAKSIKLKNSSNHVTHLMKLETQVNLTSFSSEIEMLKQSVKLTCFGTV